MARKTVIRRLAKRLPSSADLDQVIEHDNEAVGFVQQPAQEQTAPIVSQPSRLLAAIASGNDDAQVETADVQQEATQ